MNISLKARCPHCEHAFAFDTSTVARKSTPRPAFLPECPRCLRHLEVPAPPPMIRPGEPLETDDLSRGFVIAVAVFVAGVASAMLALAALMPR